MTLPHRFIGTWFVRKATLGLLLVAWSAAAGIGSPADAWAAENADEQAVRQAVAAYVAAFNKKDLMTVVNMWSPTATHVDRESGVQSEGRAAIQADIQTSWKEHPQATLSGRVERVRFVRPDVARLEGQTQLDLPGEDPVITGFSALMVREQNRWLIDSIEELPVPRPASPAEALGELAWLVGDWVDKSDGVQVETTFRWSPSRAYLLRSFQVQTAEGQSHQGTQIIGYDPRSQQIRSWIFNSDGSFGDGTWSRHDQQWLIKSSQTLADGRASSGTFVLTKIDDNTISLQLIGHEVEGEPQPATPAVTAVRVQPAAAPNTSSPVGNPASATPARSAPATSASSSSSTSTLKSPNGSTPARNR